MGRGECEEGREVDGVGSGWMPAEVDFFFLFDKSNN